MIASLLQPSTPVALSPQVEESLLAALLGSPINLPPTDPPEPLSERLTPQLWNGLEPRPSHSSQIPLPTSQIPLHSLASSFNLPLPVLLDWLALPSTRARLAAACDIDDFARHRRHQSARARALDELERVLTTSDDPVERRRAASAILRPIHARSPLSRPTSTEVREQSRQPVVALPAAPTHPVPTRTPAEVLSLCLQRLQHNHNPVRHSGLRTLHTHIDRCCRRGRDDNPNKYVEIPGDDIHLTGFSSAIAHAPVLLKKTNENEPDVFGIRVDLIAPDGRPRRTDFTLQRCGYAKTDIKPWLITSITHHDEPHPDSS